MSSPIFAEGEAIITPPLGDVDITVGDWFVNDDGATLHFSDDEGYARNYDDTLTAIVCQIAACGSRVNGFFEWSCDDEGDFGKTVIVDNVITEYAGFKAYADGTTENANFRWVKAA